MQKGDETRHSKVRRKSCERLLALGVSAVSDSLRPALPVRMEDTRLACARTRADAFSSNPSEAAA